RGSVNDDQHPVVPVATEATRMLRPGWDSSDRLWMVDRTAFGAVVSYVDAAAGSVPTAVDVRGVTGRQVKRFIISRDGTRLVAIVKGRDRDVLRVSRITHDSTGKVIGATRSRSLPWSSGDTQRIKDIGWQSPTLAGVLHLVTTRFPQVVSVSVDGAGPQATVGQSERASQLVASPDSQDPLYTWSPQQLFGLSSGAVDLPPGFTSVQYVG
ncbi:MAG: LpqB family beta-propeller domain-containing protein, partial [Nocardioides sp.]